MKPPRNAPRKTPEQSSSRTVRGATPTRSPFELAVAQLTTDFVEAVISAIASASLDDLVEGDAARKHFTRNDLVTLDASEADAPPPSRRQNGSSRPPYAHGKEAKEGRPYASSESNGAGSVPPTGIEDITNPDVLLAMFGGGGLGGGGPKEAPAAPKALPKILMTPTPAHAPAASTASSASSAGSASGETKGEEAAAAPASTEAPPTSRAVSSGPRLRPGEEILRASAGGGAVIRRRRV